MITRSSVLPAACALVLLAGCSGTPAPVVDGSRANAPVPPAAASPAVPSAAETAPPPAETASAPAREEAPQAASPACDPAVKSPVPASAVRVEKTPTSPCKKRPVQSALREIPDFLQEYECRGPSRITLDIVSEDERVFFSVLRPETGKKVELQPVTRTAFTRVHGPARWYARDKGSPEVVAFEVRGSYSSDDKLVTFTTIGAWRLDSGALCRAVDHDAKKDGPVDAVAARLATEVLGGGCDCPVESP